MRTRTRNSDWCVVGYHGMPITQSGTDARYGIRPAFTIPNTTKIKQFYSEELNKDIYVFE